MFLRFSFSFYLAEEFRETPEVDMKNSKAPTKKRARLDNDEMLLVPPFLSVGERVKIRLEGDKAEYVSRAPR